MILDIVGLQKQENNDSESDCRCARTSPRNNAALWLTRSAGRFQKKSAEMFQDRSARRWGNIEATKIKLRFLSHQKKVQRKTSGKLSNIIRRLKNIYLRCQNSSVRRRYPAMGEEGNDYRVNMVRGKAKKKFEFFLIYYDVWIWREEKAKKKLAFFLF